jgi:hypothetical protein
LPAAVKHRVHQCGTRAPQSHRRKVAGCGQVPAASMAWHWQGSGSERWRRACNRATCTARTTHTTLLIASMEDVPLLLIWWTLTSSFVSFLTNFAGLPAHSSPSGTRRAGGKTEPGARMEKLSIIEPSSNEDRAPTMQLSPMRQDRSTQAGSTMTFLPMMVAAVRPEGDVLKVHRCGL